MEPDKVFFAEERFISFLLRNPKKIMDSTLGLHHDDFFSIQGAACFKAITLMELSGIDVGTHSIVTYLGKEKDKKGISELDKIGGIDTIVAIASQPEVSPEEAEVIKEQILSSSKLRKIQGILTWANENQTNEPDELINQVEKKLETLNNSGNPSSILIANDMTELEERITLYADPNSKVVGISSGYELLDGLLDGFKLGETSCWYAPSSRYKSMLTSNIGTRLAQNGYPGLWIPTEMTSVQLQERLLQFQSGLNFRYLRADKRFADYLDDIEYAKDSLKDLPIYVSKSQDRDVNSIIRQMKKEKRWHDIQYVIIDMLDHCYSHIYQDNEISNQSEVVRKLSLAAKDIGIHLILVSHISKEEKALRGRHVIPMEEIKGSSSKYQDIETAVSIMPAVKQQDDDGVKRWRGLSVNEISYRQQKRALINLYVSVQKNRNGMLGDVLFQVDPIQGNRIVEIGTP